MDSTRKKRILFIGNPGTGKSTLLNCHMASRKSHLVKEELFPCGVNIGEGMTFQFDVRELSDAILMDTPGLHDIKRRREAAAEITKALKQDGCYQIIFIVTLESGRVSPEDVTVIRLVLESANEIKYCGIIFNKLTDNILRLLREDPKNKIKLLAEVSLQNEKSLTLMNPLFLQRFKELDDMDNTYIRILELDKFLDEVPEVVIQKENVNELEIDKFEKMKEELEKKISKLQQDNNLMEKKIIEMSLQYKEKLKNLKETQEEEHKAAMQKVEEKLEKNRKDMEQKRAEHKEELEQIRQQNLEKDKELERLLHKKDESRKLEDYYQKMQLRLEKHQQDLMENHKRFMANLAKQDGVGSYLSEIIGTVASVVAGFFF